MAVRGVWVGGGCVNRVLGWTYLFGLDWVFFWGFTNGWVCIFLLRYFLPNYIPEADWTFFNGVQIIGAGFGVLRNTNFHEHKIGLFENFQCGPDFLVPTLATRINWAYNACGENVGLHRLN